ncbi:MAG: MBL fold metallo-hydrolase [Pseudomonadota bacterium]
MNRQIQALSAATLIALSAVMASPARALAEEIRVNTYASQVNDVDSANNHWFETESGVVLIDAQRLLPEAERALRHLRATTSRPVVAIVITHAHTDHYGGLPVWTDAFPEARVITDATTLQSIRTDGRGFIAMRNQRHGDRFATRERLTKAVEAAEVVDVGDVLEIGGATLSFDVFGPSEAEATLLVTIEDANIAFVGDLINVGAPAVPFENVDNWLAQLDTLAARYGAADRLHIGHGPSPVRVGEIAEQRRFLNALRGAVVAGLENDNVLDAAEIDRIVFDLEAAWPFLQGVAGNTRREVLAFAAERVALQLGSETADKDPNG